jgi:hypothetical protein
MQGKSWTGKYEHDSLYGHKAGIKALKLLPCHGMLLTGQCSSWGQQQLGAAAAGGSGWACSSVCGTTWQQPVNNVWECARSMLMLSACCSLVAVARLLLLLL